MSGAEYEELYLASVRVPLVLVIFLGLWGIVILVLQSLQIDFSSVLRKASGCFCDNGDYQPPAELKIAWVAPRCLSRCLGAPRDTSGPRVATEDDEPEDTTRKGKPHRVPMPPSWRQVVTASGVFLGILLACNYGSRLLLVPPTVAVGGFYFILGAALLVPLQAPSVRDHTSLFFTSLARVFFPATDVHLSEVLVADALTSLSRVFADVAVTFLLVGRGWGVTCPGWCFRLLPCVFASCPYWVRVRQCWTQLSAEVDAQRRRLLMINVGKYMSAFPVIWLTGYQAIRQDGGMISSSALGNCIVAAALFNSMYSFAWDVRMDWGLGQPGAKRWGLRNSLLISPEDPWPYYVAVGLDFVLRLTWLARLADGWFRYRDLVLTLELIEVLRRSMWTVFRLEWECVQCLGGAKPLRLDKGSEALKV
ncbi:unnamed protein product [Ascophyllum nodosum]